jgi:apolipoprotein N-acyltransferase
VPPTNEDDPGAAAPQPAELRRDAATSLALMLAALVLAGLAWAYHRWTGYAGLWIHGIPWAVALLAGVRALVQGVRWLHRRRAERRDQPAARSHSRR